MEDSGQPPGAMLRGGNDAEAQRDAARQMGSSQSERKGAAARENGKRGGRPKGYQVSEASRAKQTEAMRRAWQRRKDSG